MSHTDASPYTTLAWRHATQDATTTQSSTPARASPLLLLSTTHTHTQSKNHTANRCQLPFGVEQEKSTASKRHQPFRANGSRPRQVCCLYECASTPKEAGCRRRCLTQAGSSTLQVMSTAPQQVPQQCWLCLWCELYRPETAPDLPTAGHCLQQKATDRKITPTALPS